MKIISGVAVCSADSLEAPFAVIRACMGYPMSMQVMPIFLRSRDKQHVKRRSRYLLSRNKNNIAHKDYLVDVSHKRFDLSREGGLSCVDAIVISPVVEVESTKNARSRAYHLPFLCWSVTFESVNAKVCGGPNTRVTTSICARGKLSSSQLAVL